MAKGATIYKCNLNMVDMDTHNYSEHHLVMAKHPSESDLRLMVRLVAFGLHADERLVFSKGIAQDDEPDLWRHSLGGDIELWIDIGQPEEKRIRKACGRSKAVVIYIYQKGSGAAWLKQNEKFLRRFDNLSVVYLDMDQGLERLMARTMEMQCQISDGETIFLKDEESIHVHPIIWKPFS